MVAENVGIPPQQVNIFLSVRARPRLLLLFREDERRKDSRQTRRARVPPASVQAARERGGGKCCEQINEIWVWEEEIT